MEYQHPVIQLALLQLPQFLKETELKRARQRERDIEEERHKKERRDRRIRVTERDLEEEKQTGRSRHRE